MVHQLPKLRVASSNLVARSIKLNDLASTTIEHSARVWALCGAAKKFEVGIAERRGPR